MIAPNVSATGQEPAFQRPGAQNPKLETIVQIPARASSKRLADKNIRMVGGHPLLAWSVRFATLLPSVDRVIINTDSERYAAIAQEYGAEVLFIRPRELAGDKASMADVNTFVIWELRRAYGIPDDGVFYAKLVTLLPTSLFRNLNVVERLIDELERYKWVQVGVETAVPWQQFCLRRGEELVPVGDRVDPGAHDVLYFKGLGNFAGMAMKKMDRFKRVYKVTDPMECVDVDTRQDLELVRHIVDQDLYDFGVKLW